jgi:hypothetical protein
MILAQSQDHEKTGGTGVLTCAGTAGSIPDSINPVPEQERGTELASFYAGGGPGLAAPGPLPHSPISRNRERKGG